MKANLSWPPFTNKALKSGNRYYKIVSLILLLTLFSFYSYSQVGNKGMITGMVIDSTNSQPIGFATISLFAKNANTPLTGMSTNTKGEFIFNGLNNGDYHVTVSFMGYHIKSVSNIVICPGTPVVSLGKLLLTTVSNNLQAVTITAKTPVMESKVDKFVYNAASDLTSQGGTATDILAKIPMVSVDADGNIELQGNANIRFLINGKPSTMYGANITDVLQTIPASQIQSVEVVTSPGAKYDAAGTGGIINIVLKENKLEGINGNIALSAGTRLQNSSLNLNVKTAKFGLNAFLSGNRQLNSRIFNLANRLSYNDTKDTLTRFTQDRKSPFKRNGYQTGLNFEWAISPKDEVTVSIGYNQINNTASGVTAQDQQTFLSSGAVLNDLVSRRITATTFGENAVTWSLGYNKSFKNEKRKLVFLYTASYSTSNNYDSQITNYLTGNYPTNGIRTNNPGNDHLSEISINYAEPLFKNFELQTGVKAVLENINNYVHTDTLLNDGTFITNSGQTYNFSFDRNIYAAYVSTNFSLFRNFLHSVAGIRYEYTDTKSGFDELNIPKNNIWAPNLLLSHKLNESQLIKFAFTYRIERPDYEDLNPFLEVIDPHNIDTGDPTAKNETGHKFELAYSKSFTDNSNIYIGAFYNKNNNDLQSFTTFYPVYTANGTKYYNVAISKTTNIGSQTTWGLNFSGSIVFNEYFDLRSNIFLLNKNNFQPGLPSVGGFSYQANLNATYHLKKGLVAEAFGTFNSKRIDFQSVRPRSYNYTFAVKKQFLNKKANIGFVTTNPFNEFVNQYSSAYGQGFTQTVFRQRSLRSFGITISYKFGNLKNKDVDNDNRIPDLGAN